MTPRTITILGSTGSIGRSAEKIIRAFPDKFRVHAVVAGSDAEKLAAQAVAMCARKAVIADPRRLELLRSLLPHGISAECGSDAICAAAAAPEVDTVLCAVVGTGGLLPVLAAIDAGKQIALASKEVMVMAGELVTRRLNGVAARIIPVDSEHSAIFQCLQGRRPDEVARLWLTASGGAFRDLPGDKLHQVTWQDAMRHPTWSMGPKVTIDSASLMNKALELVEARHLFGIAPDKLEVILHPQSIVHSFIELVDGTMIAQAATPDMRFAIQYALLFPERFDGGLPRLTPDAMSALTFAAPDRRKYPSLDIAMHAMRCGGTMPTVMNAANEVAVEKFRRSEIAFPKIWSIIEQTMGKHQVFPQENLDAILAADIWAREMAAGL